MQERAARTREVILQAAAEVFDECGYNGASIKSVMERAGVTQGGLYFHFPSKKALARTVMSAPSYRLAMPPGEDGLQRLIDLTVSLAAQMQTDVILRAGVRLAVEQGAFGGCAGDMGQSWADAFGYQMTAASLRGELQPDVDIGEVVEVLMHAYTGTALFSHTGRDSAYRRVVATWRYLLLSVASQGARLEAHLPSLHQAAA
ncbi:MULTISPECIES: ScbR family autoregulator-binding transcription factor [Streptomyces]|uniref:ScbR family autoregulator-binding transcription factor n=1 Tax=Streptomyces TaxID=1883 RepID=UPI000518F4B8|nr:MULTISPECIES: ScbR family autoregulator-binding transcription factor [Streptomyces]KOT47274.1 branched-chain amino acid aminotransferase [Streptomyces rimosus subsp. rimosus]